MKILYLHGFGGHYSPRKKKVQALSQLGEVSGYDIDWTKPAEDLIDEGENHLDDLVDLVVGISMGGWLAATLANIYEIPFVAINPMIDPQGSSLLKTLLPAEIIDGYSDFPKDGAGLILLDEGDKSINSFTTFDTMQEYYDCRLFPEGSHRFEHIEESIPCIQSFVDLTEFTWGRDNDND